MDQAELSYGDHRITLPIVEGSEGERGLDISRLRSQTGMITLDPGYVNTGSCESEITFIDGEKGILRHRGYAIEDLCEKCDFLEVAYMVIYGQLPDQATYDEFKREINRHLLVHEDVQTLINAFPVNAHPMAMFISVVSSLAAFYPGETRTEEEVDLAIYRLLAKLPTIAAWCYRRLKGLPYVHPRENVDYALNFLRMMFSSPTKDLRDDLDLAKALDQLFILHADHEQNCSAATVRIIGSSQVHLFTTISGGMSALWGPLHGGANQAVIEMLQRIHDDGGNIQKYLEMAKDKNNEFRLMGFGHRVYKNFDPRARIIKKQCDYILNKLHITDPLLGLAQKLEEAALADSYFVDRKLYPNVDFYSGIIYKAMGIPVSMFTPMFALGRLPGWIAQWRELMLDPKVRIGRPRQVYQGPTLRDCDSKVTHR